MDTTRCASNVTDCQGRSGNVTRRQGGWAGAAQRHGGRGRGAGVAAVRISDGLSAGRVSGVCVCLGIFLDRLNEEDEDEDDDEVEVDEEQEKKEKGSRIEMHLK